MGIVGIPPSSKSSTSTRPACGRDVKPYTAPSLPPSLQPPIKQLSASAPSKPSYHDTHHRLDDRGSPRTRQQPVTPRGPSPSRDKRDHHKGGGGFMSTTSRGASPSRDKRDKRVHHKGGGGHKPTTSRRPSPSSRDGYIKPETRHQNPQGGTARRNQGKPRQQGGKPRNQRRSRYQNREHPRD